MIRDTIPYPCSLLDIFSLFFHLFAWGSALACQVPRQAKSHRPTTKRAPSLCDSISTGTKTTTCGLDETRAFRLSAPHLMLLGPHLAKASLNMGSLGITSSNFLASSRYPKLFPLFVVSMNSAHCKVYPISYPEKMYRSSMHIKWCHRSTWDPKRND